MKKFLLSSVALLGFTAGAMAADLPRRAPPVFVPVPVFTWTGFYVGVNAGYAWNNATAASASAASAACRTVDTTPPGLQRSGRAALRRVVPGRWRRRQ